MAARIIEQLIEIPAEHERNIFGQFDEHIKKIERTLQVTLISRDGVLKIVGPAPNVQKAESIIRELLGLSVRGNTIQSQNVDYALSLTMEEKEASLGRWIKIVSVTRSTEDRSNQRPWDRKHMWIRSGKI